MSLKFGFTGFKNEFKVAQADTKLSSLSSLLSQMCLSH